jgi:hypothetical protein
MNEQIEFLAVVTPTEKRHPETGAKYTHDNSFILKATGTSEALIAARKAFEGMKLKARKFKGVIQLTKKVKP